MPFGMKPDGRGGAVDFDAVYDAVLAPAIREATLEPLRADQELVGGIIHKAMFERLILADYAVADLTTANANVFYELGVRHAARPFSTVLVSADVKRVPFDLVPDRVLPYALDGRGLPADADNDRGAVVAALHAARDADGDPRSRRPGPRATCLVSLPSVTSRRPVVDHDHLVDRVGMEWDPIAGCNLFEDQRDVVDTSAGIAAGIDEQRPLRVGTEVVWVALVEGRVVEARDDRHLLPPGLLA